MMTLVHSPTKISVARSLRGDQAQDLIDIIDQVGGSLVDVCWFLD